MDLDLLKRQLSELPLETEWTWSGDRRRSAASVDGDPMDVILWVEEGTNRLLMVDAVAYDAGVEVELAALGKAIQRPLSGKPGRPGRVRLPQEATRKQLEQVLEGVEIGPLEQSEALNRAFQGLESVMEGQRLSLLGQGVTPPLVDRFARTACELWEWAPWRSIVDIDFARLDGLEVSPIWASILGGEGVEIGLAMFLDQGSARAGLAGDGQSLRQSRLLSLTYLDPSEAGPKLMREYEQFGWPRPEPGRYPFLVTTQHRPTPAPTAPEIEVCLQTFQALRKGLASLKGGYCNLTLDDGRRVRLRWPSPP